MRFILVILFLKINLCFSQTDSIQRFIDYKKINWINQPHYISFFEPDSFSVDWGLKTLDRLNLQGLDNYNKASRIQKYIHENFGCTGRQYSIHKMIINKRGNCADHAVISTFLLRLAEIPAKFAFEINIKHNFFWWGNKAKKMNCGLFGYNHNDHVWVLFFDGKLWHPFDSELDVLGIDNFVEHRWGKVSPYFLGIGSYGPPFIIWEDTGNGLLNMKNITKEIWSHKSDDTFSKVNKKDWFDFVTDFKELTYEQLQHNVLSHDKEFQIKKMAKIWF